MADLTITAGNVTPGADAKTEHGTAGEALTPAQPIYKDASTGKYLKCDSDSATVAAKAPRGITLATAALNQPITILRGGDLNLGAILTAGDPYYLSNTAGGICPKADVGAGETVVPLGFAESTSVLHVDIQLPGVTL